MISFLGCSAQGIAVAMVWLLSRFLSVWLSETF
jgi:hypothetical protein